jgi:long-chain acyl-CoA synthetase
MTLPRLFPTPVHMLADAVAMAPQAPALREGARTLTYAEYGAAVAGLAAWLQGQGAGAGKIVGVHMTNALTMPVALLGVMASGAQLCPTNPAYSVRELADILADAGPLLILTQAEHVETLKAAAPGVTVRVLADVLAALPEGAALTPDRLDPDAPALLQYTGGTSGRAKGVNLTHRALAVNVSQREAVLPMRMGAERILCVMPMFHSFASAMGLLMALHSHGLLCIQPRYRPEWVVEALVGEAITVFPAGPTLFNSLLGFAPFLAQPYPALRMCVSGSAALPEATLAAWERATGCPIYEGYGQTEAGPVLTFNGPTVGARVGAVGPALPLTDIQIVDVETGAPLADPGQPGEIRARGPQIMTGYRNQPDETAATLRDGWLHTGDIGRFDEAGFLRIEDRKKDMVIVSGYNVFPREIDEVLMAHPAVVEAACVGVPDSYRGEVLKALVVLREGSLEAVAAHCAANLAPYKRPSALLAVDALPKTTVGKIDKKAIRAQLIDQSQAGAAA